YFAAVVACRPQLCILMSVAAVFVRKAKMKFSRSALVGPAAFVAAVAAAVAFPVLAMAQNNPLTGTWEYHPEKSTTQGGALPKSLKLTFDAQGTMTVEGTDAKGQPIKGSIPAVADGKPHPVTGMAEYDTATYTKFNDTTASYNYQKRKSTAVLGN